MYIILVSSEGSGAGKAYGPYDTKKEANEYLDQMFPKDNPEFWDDGVWICCEWYDVLKMDSKNLLHKHIEEYYE